MHFLRFAVLGVWFFVAGCTLHEKSTTPQHKAHKQETQDKNMLHAVFLNVHHMAPLLGGLSSTRLYKFQHQDAFYVARFMSHSIARHDFEKEVNAQKRASVLGLAPRIDYVDAAQRLFVMRYVPGGNLWGVHLTKAALKNFAKQLAKLHNIFCTKEERSCKNVISAERFLKFQTQNLAYQKRRQRFCALEAQLLSKSPRAFCHMDVHPGNLIVHKEKQVAGRGNEVVVMLIDWTDAQIYSPYYDLARFAIDAFLTPAQEAVFLEEYSLYSSFAFDAALYQIAKEMAHLRQVDALLSLGGESERDVCWALSENISTTKRAQCAVRRQKVLKLENFRDVLFALNHKETRLCFIHHGVHS